MAKEDRDPLVEIRNHNGVRFSFTDAAAFNEWLLVESDQWQVFKSPLEDSSDPIGDLGSIGAAEVAEDWKSLSEQISRTIALKDAHVSDVAAAGVSKTLNERLEARSLVLSSSQAGQTLLALHTSDPASARVALSVMTGRNISRVTHPQHIRALWRAIFFSSIDGRSDLTNSSDRVVAALQSAERSSAEVTSMEAQVRGVLANASREIEVDSAARTSALNTILEELTETTNAKLSAIDREWLDLRATYDTKLALKAPRNYWHRRRITHRVAASIWGLVAIAIGVVAALKLLPTGAAMLRAAHGRTAFRFVDWQNQGIWNYLPEILQILVVGFFVLWGLRFSLRQVSENLVRLEEASQRVTMVETFLAFSNPADGQQSVVGEADRAVIIQALFRPSSPGPIDEAPPVHWIEEVLRKLRNSNG